MEVLRWSDAVEVHCECCLVCPAQRQHDRQAADLVAQKLLRQKGTVLTCSAIVPPNCDPPHRPFCGAQYVAAFVPPCVVLTFCELDIQRNMEGHSNFVFGYTDVHIQDTKTALTWRVATHHMSTSCRKVQRLSRLRSHCSQPDPEQAAPEEPCSSLDLYIRQSSMSRPMPQ